MKAQQGIVIGLLSGRTQLCLASDLQDPASDIIGIAFHYGS
jgi:hypothetical protein